MRMHSDQVDIADATAALLVRRALPEAAQLPIHRIRSSATTSHIFRIGEGLAARFPMQGTSPYALAEQLRAEQAAMAEHASASAFPCPAPRGVIPASAEHPLPWTLQTWVEGEIATPRGVESSAPFAEDLAAQIASLREAPTRGRTFSGSGRGGRLCAHDAWIAECLERSEDLLPVARLRILWSRWRQLPREQADAMTHGDLIPANLLTTGGRLAGVLDAGGFRAADPALDLVGAWHLLDAPRRALVRERLDCSELEWERGAAWAFAQAIGLVWYYQSTNPPMAELGRITLGRLLEASG